MPGNSLAAALHPTYDASPHTQVVCNNEPMRIDHKAPIYPWSLSPARRKWDECLPSMPLGGRSSFHCRVTQFASHDGPLIDHSWETRAIHLRLSAHLVPQLLGRNYRMTKRVEPDQLRKIQYVCLPVSWPKNSPKSRPSNDQRNWHCLRKQLYLIRYNLESVPAK